MDEKNKKPLPFPVNCPPAQDYFSGIGSKELGIITVVTVIAFVFFPVLLSNYGEIIAISVSFSIIAITFVLIRRNSQQESIIDQIVQIYKYYRAQKQFEYEYHDEFEV